MGAEATCTVEADGRRASGKALLETNELLFRSPELRLKITFSSIRSLEARDGVLRVRHTDGLAEFHVGAKAEAWAEKIRNPKGLLEKLGVKPEHRVVALGITDAAFMDQLRARAPNVSTRLRKDADVVFVQADKLTDLQRLEQLEPSIRRDGMIWTVTPKGKGGLKDTDVMAAGKAAGLVDVKVAAFSATHTATKFVIPKTRR